MEDTRDTGCIVGSVVLEFACAERLLKGLLLVHKVVDSVGLVAVCDDELVAENSYGSIDDEVRIGEFARVKSLCADSLAVLNENSVAAVYASAHDEVSCNSVFSAVRLAYNDTSAGICV